MDRQQPAHRSEIGMVGLGVMGRNFLLNMADHGFAVAGYDRDSTKVGARRQETAGGNLRTNRTNSDHPALNGMLSSARLSVAPRSGTVTRAAGAGSRG